MTILAQNGKIWNPRSSAKKKKTISPRTLGYLLLATVFTVPSLLATLNMIPSFVSRHAFYIENHQLVQTLLSANWLIFTGVFLSALLFVFFVSVAFKANINDMRIVVIGAPALLALLMPPVFVNINHSSDIDSANINSWVQQETNSSVEVSGMPYINSRIITTEKGKSYLLTSTGDDKKKIFTLKEIETKG